MRLLIITWAMVFITSCSTANTHGLVAPPLATALITFVFDDGNDSDYLVGRDIFLEQGAVACSAITTDWINTPGHLTPGQIRALRDAGWEIMSHTVSHPKLTSLDAAQIEGEFAVSKTVLENMGVSVRNVVYPKNMSNELVRTIARKYYRSGRGGAYAVNTSNTDPYYLKSYPIKHDLPGMERTIDRAYAGRSWIIFYQHEIDIKADLREREGKFIPGETLRFSPSGAVGRCESPAWFQYFGSLYFVPISGTPLEGDRISGQDSSATARIKRILYDDRSQLRNMIRYVRTRYPDMRIVTIDQGLDILGIAKQTADGDAGKDRTSRISRQVNKDGPEQVRNKRRAAGKND
jgi:peptidoglycan/xylan/chitin deacetylase (PgdA/CDA1 family)